MSQTQLIRRPDRIVQRRAKDIKLKIKVVVTGDTLVGKSSLIKRYCEDGFQKKYITTIGIDYGVRTAKVDDKVVGIHFWDMSGRPEFVDVRNEFYKDTDVLIIMFDVTSRASFSRLPQWINEFQEYSGPDTKPIKVLVGAKTDKDGRIVDRKEAQGWAQGNGFSYYEVSSVTAEGVFEMFDGVFHAATKQKSTR